MMKRILFLLTAAVLLAAALPVFAQSAASGSIVVTADAKNSNPTLVFTGGLSDQALSAKILSDFQNCGWFTVLKSGSAAYHVSAKGTLQNFTVTVANSAGVPVCNPFNVSNSKDVNSAAHMAVDTVLNRIFGIQGICRSKIVFSVATSSKNREIFICDFDGTNITQLTKHNTLCVNPVWAPDGKSVLYSYYEGFLTNLVQHNLELGPRRLTRDGGIDGIGSLSPDGKTLAMILTRNKQVDLYVRPTESDNSKLVRLTSGKALESGPCWSPDGKKLCFVSDAKNGRPVLCVIDPVAGGKPVEISGLVGSERLSPSWSVDNKLAYCARINRNYELRVAKLSADGKSGVMEKVGVAGNDTFRGEDPSWAPDGRHVTLTMDNAIYVIDTRLGAKRKLVSGSGKVGQSNWSPILK
ncbi:MAG: PD40 domain-containing protein [Lentisphaeria bacterium]|nr:PD40 domain-containing protein [Lentisphaeria bacterium]